MAKIEYPKWLYHDKLPALIVKDIETHMVKQEEGYYSRLGAEKVYLDIPSHSKDEEVLEDEIAEEAEKEVVAKKCGRPRRLWHKLLH